MSYEVSVIDLQVCRSSLNLPKSRNDRRHQSWVKTFLCKFNFFERNFLVDNHDDDDVDDDDDIK